MRIDAVISGIQLNSTENAGISDNAGIIQRLNVGDVVRAKIMSITSSELLLQLMDGSSIKAASVSPLNAGQGEYIDLTVKSKGDNHLVLETLKNEPVVKPLQTTDNALSLLLSIGVKPDSSKESIVKEMTKNSIPFNKENFEKLLSIVEGIEKLPLEKAAFLFANGMKPEKPNISALTQFAEQRYRIGEELVNITNMLSGAIEDLGGESSPGDLKSAAPINKPVVSLQEKVGNVTAENNAEQQGEGAKTISGSVTNAGENKGSVSNKDAVKSLSADKNPALKMNNNLLPVILGKVITEMKAETGNNKLPASLNSLIESKPITEKLQDLLLMKKGDTVSSKDIIEYLQKENILPEKMSANMSQTTKDYFTKLSEKLNRAFAAQSVESAELASAQAKNDDIGIRASTDFKELFTKISHDTKDLSFEPVKTYRELLTKLEQIRDYLQNSAVPNRGEIIGRIDNLENNIRFMNELNNYSTYVQIPLSFNEKNTTGELFILKKGKGRKKIDPESATMFISLDTENLGMVDSLVTVKKKSISLNIRASDEKVIEFIKENVDELYSRLKEKGYKLVAVKYRMMNEDLNLLNYKEVYADELKDARVTIDYRL